MSLVITAAAAADSSFDIDNCISKGGVCTAPLHLQVRLE